MIIKEIGQKYNKLTILSYSRTDDKKIFVFAKCDCGNEKEMQLYNIISGNSKSCGKCPKQELLDEIGRKYSNWTILSLSRSDRFHKRYVIARCELCQTEHEVCLATLRNGTSKACKCVITTHQMIHDRIYTIWSKIVQRCTNPNNKGYVNYGGRGITVCDEWLIFINFYNDMKDTYQDNLTIERINNDLGYYKENCKWATYKEQARNRRSLKLSEADAILIKQRYKNGESYASIARDYNCYYTTISSCVKGKTWA